MYPADGSEKIAHGDVRFKPNDPGNWDLYVKMMVDLFTEFAEGVRNNSNAKITNTLEEAQKSTSCVIYGDLAFRTKSNVEIDASTINIENNAEAKSMLTRDYRAPYQHPYTS